MFLSVQQHSKNINHGKLFHIIAATILQDNCSFECFLRISELAQHFYLAHGEKERLKWDLSTRRDKMLKAKFGAGSRMFALIVCCVK